MESSIVLVVAGLLADTLNSVAGPALVRRVLREGGGLTDLHEMNGLKSLMSAILSAVSVATIPSRG
nr:hypothetical protein [Methylobacterium sp. ZNC0032]